MGMARCYLLASNSVTLVTQIYISAEEMVDELKYRAEVIELNAAFESFMVMHHIDCGTTDDRGKRLEDAIKVFTELMNKQDEVPGKGLAKVGMNAQCPNCKTSNFTSHRYDTIWLCLKCGERFDTAKMDNQTPKCRSQCPCRIGKTNEP